MRCLLVCLSMALVPFAASAEVRQDLTALRAGALGFVADTVALRYPDTQASITIGTIDGRLKLPHCPKPTYAFSTGSADWGSGNLVLACASPSSWHLYVTYRVDLEGPALLALKPLPAGAAPSPTDVALGQATYRGNPGRYLRQAANLAGTVVTRPIARGEALTVDHLRTPPVIKAGQRVRIRILGPGFEVNRDGIAQNPAGIGETVRVKTESGRLIQAIVQPDGSAQVRP